MIEDDTIRVRRMHRGEGIDDEPIPEPVNPAMAESPDEDDPDLREVRSMSEAMRFAREGRCSLMVTTEGDKRTRYWRYSRTRLHGATFGKTRRQWVGINREAFLDEVR